MQTPLLQIAPPKAEGNNALDPTRRRSLAIDYAAYLGLRLFVCLIQAVPYSMGVRIAELLARIVHRLDARHRHVARENLLLAFGNDLDEQGAERLVRETYRHFCTMLVEIGHLPRKLHSHNRFDYIRYATEERKQTLVQLLKSPRPLLMVSGHFGNWEVANFYLGLTGYRSHAVARPLDNQFIERFLHRFREKTGQKLLAKKGSLEQIGALLDSGGRVALLADQDAGPRGLFVNFFGQPASTHKGVALLALNHQAPLIVVGARRIGEPMQYEMIVEEVIFPEHYENRADAVRLISQRYMTALERLVRTAPEQYFWLHRRWKSQPARTRRMAA